MAADHLVRIVTEPKNDVTCYQIFGLNIFISNTHRKGEDLLEAEMGEFPYLKFLSCLANSYRTICLIGSPAPENWMNDLKVQGKTVNVYDFLENDTPYRQVPIWYYGGTFGRGNDYGPSIVFELAAVGTLTRLPAAFTAWDAIALLLYEKGKNGIEAVTSTLLNLTAGEAIIETLLQEAKYLIISQADYQYLEVYTKVTGVEEELNTACEEAVRYITGTAWYQANKSELSWDDLEQCYVRQDS